MKESTNKEEDLRELRLTMKEMEKERLQEKQVLESLFKSLRRLIHAKEDHSKLDQIISYLDQEMDKLREMHEN